MVDTEPQHWSGRKRTHKGDVKEDVICAETLTLRGEMEKVQQSELESWFLDRHTGNPVLALIFAPRAKSVGHVLVAVMDDSKQLVYLDLHGRGTPGVYVKTTFAKLYTNSKFKRDVHVITADIPKPTVVKRELDVD